MIDFTQVKLGKNDPVLDDRTLKFETYFAAKPLVYPSFCTWSKRISSWPMLLNNQLGNCTCASALHMEQAWSTNAGGSFIPTDAQALTAYKAFGYDPSDPSTDQGADMLSVLKYWKSTGIGGNKIGAFASIDLTNRGHLLAATFLLG